MKLAYADRRLRASLPGSHGQHRNGSVQPAKLGVSPHDPSRTQCAVKRYTQNGTVKHALSLGELAAETAYSTVTQSCSLDRSIKHVKASHRSDCQRGGSAEYELGRLVTYQMVSKTAMVPFKA